MVRPRQATTDMQGAFEFTGVAAGTYRIQASPNQFSPQYLGMAYGGTKPSGPGSMDIGQPIQLAEGQSFDKAVIALPRGGVITGRVTDENAEPLARVQVYTLYFPPGSARGMRMGSGSQTDDLGQFRIYGLVARRARRRGRGQPLQLRAAERAAGNRGGQDRFRHDVLPWHRG